MGVVFIVTSDSRMDASFFPIIALPYANELKNILHAAY